MVGPCGRKSAMHTEAGVGRACFPAWRQTSATGNPAGKNMGFGVTDLGLDYDSIIFELCILGKLPNCSVPRLPNCATVVTVLCHGAAGRNGGAP